MPLYQVTLIRRAECEQEAVLTVQAESEDEAIAEARESVQDWDYDTIEADGEEPFAESVVEVGE